MDIDQARLKVIASALRDLTLQPAWETYRHLMEQAEATYIERTITGTREDFDRHKGIIEGLRLAYNLPERYKQYLTTDE